MKKILAVFLVIGTFILLAGSAWADNINTTNVTPITIQDGHYNPGAPMGDWYGQQEYQEVEWISSNSYATPGNTWDLRGMWWASGKLYVVTGFNPNSGGGNESQYPMGDLFIMTTDTPVLTDHNGVGSTQANSVFGGTNALGYDVAVTIGGKGYSLSPETYLRNADASSSLGAANPFKVDDYSTVTSLDPQSFPITVKVGEITSGSGQGYNFRSYLHLRHRHK